MKPVLSVILLAAGESQRLGRAKQLVEIDGVSLVRRAAELVLTLEPEHCLVVTGAGSAEVTAELEGLPLRCEYNAIWKAGMSASIACGVRALPGNMDGVLVFLCDQWRVSRAELHSLFATWNEDTSRIVHSAWSGAIGPPVIFPASCLGHLRALTGDHGARAVIQELSHMAKGVMLDAAQYDMDTQADLDKMQKLLTDDKDRTS